MLQDLSLGYRDESQLFFYAYEIVCPNGLLLGICVYLRRSPMSL